MTCGFYTPPALPLALCRKGAVQCAANTQLDASRISLCLSSLPEHAHMCMYASASGYLAPARDEAAAGVLKASEVKSASKAHPV